MRINRAEVVARLRAVREELGLRSGEMADRIGVQRTTYVNWETANPAKPHFPSKEGMAAIREAVPGLTLDYLYLGRLDAVPAALALRLVAREMGVSLDTPEGRQGAAATLASRMRA